MATELVCDCVVATPIEMAAFPNNCGSEDYGYPYLMLFMKREGALTACTGDAPNLANLQAAQIAADENQLIVVGPITNGARVESEREEETGADTVDGMTDVISQTLNLTGKLKFLDETIREDLEDLNCQERLRMWIVTSTGWLFGACEGYNVANFISALLQDGYGTKSYIPMDYKWKAPGHDPANYDDDYLTLVNA